MKSFAAFLATVFVAAGVLAVPATNSEHLEARQGSNFAVQNWANDFADVDFVSGPAGQFSAEWNNGFGGNFVVGKGYRPGGDM